ncbi:MAG: hypothetical protein IKD69_10545 [Solobacterium sp.]|nr:hypothetical protein [Solobacterium sp.]
MKKMLLICLTAVTILTGCRPKTTADDANLDAYRTYFDSIVYNSQFTSSSEYYSISTEMVKIREGSFRYYVFFDEPQVSMYDVIILAIENDMAYNEEKMMPSIGIFDSRYSMIPYQVNLDEGYVKGIVISGECSEPQLQLKIMVEWKDHNRANTYREFHQLNLSVEAAIEPSMQYEEFDIEENSQTETPEDGNE